MVYTMPKSDNSDMGRLDSGSISKETELGSAIPEIDIAGRRGERGEGGKEIVIPA